MRRGEVWWAQVQSGKRRPAVILTRSQAIPVLHSIVVAPATRTIRGIASEVAVDRDEGMPEECVFTLDNLTLLPKSMLSARICTLGPESMRRVCAALAAAFDC